MKRNILLITTDQMRYDALGCNGGLVARTPNIDSLAKNGVNYSRAHNQNVGCMPARATIMTGQHVATHGVWMNGVVLPEETHTVAHQLQEHGYQTALLGKAHFEPWLGSPDEFFENRMASLGHTGPHRGFHHMELANHFFEGHSHYDLWMNEQLPFKERFYPMITDKGQNTASRGETGAVQAWPMEVPTELYHTNWVAQRTLDWLATQDDDTPWFCWMSFPDPHHPWDVPKQELHRHPWQDVPLPALYREDKAEREALIAQKPKHWRGYYEGSLWTNLESPREFVPAQMTADQVREINALTHIENELIDDACGRVFEGLRQKGMYDNTDIFFTTDHGELQGDFGLMFKGPYHVDALMRLPFIWQPAGGAKSAGQVVSAPVGHLDLASTFCQIADIPEPEYCEGSVLPLSQEQAIEQDRDSVITEWDSEHGPIDMHLQSLFYSENQSPKGATQGSWLYTSYAESHLYVGDEGELYDMTNDPEQLVNLWDDAGYQTQKEYLQEMLMARLPQARQPKLERRAPV